MNQFTLKIIQDINAHLHHCVTHLLQVEPNLYINDKLPLKLRSIPPLCADHIGSTALYDLAKAVHTPVNILDDESVLWYWNEIQKALCAGDDATVILNAAAAYPGMRLGFGRNADATLFVLYSGLASTRLSEIRHGIKAHVGTASFGLDDGLTYGPDFNRVWQARGFSPLQYLRKEDGPAVEITPELSALARLAGTALPTKREAINRYVSAVQQLGDKAIATALSGWAVIYEASLLPALERTPWQRAISLVADSHLEPVAELYDLLGPHVAPNVLSKTLGPIPLQPGKLSKQRREQLLSFLQRRSEQSRNRRLDLTPEAKASAAEYLHNQDIIR